MSYSYILFESNDDGIALITVNRPDKLNVLNAATMLELEDAFRRVRTDTAIRAAILTGAGEKAFVAGEDIHELAALNPVEAQMHAERGQRILRDWETMCKPSVAAVNGLALGGGLELAMACTVRFASPHARLGLPEIKLGFLPEYGGTQRLPRLMGRGCALELLLAGDPIDAAEAHRTGLVNTVVPQADLLAHSRRWLRKVLAKAPVASALILRAVDLGLNTGLDQGLRYEAAAFGLTISTEDRREGTRAFLEKRKPVFSGQ